MNSRFFLLVASFLIFACSKKEDPLPPVEIPALIIGTITEFNVDPLDITTPDKGSLLISMNNTMYKATFNAVAQAQSNAILSFESDTVLTDNSREFANLGKDAIAYNPVKENEITIFFNDGKKISGFFDPTYTSFGGVFGEALISQWRDSADPSKPNQKAKDDILNFVRRYDDADGTGPGTDPVYLLAQVSRN